MTTDQAIRGSDSGENAAFVSPRLPAILASVGLAAMLIPDTALLFLGSGSSPDDTAAIGSFMLMVAFMGLWVALLVPSAGFFLAWLNRSSKNLVALGAKGLMFDPTAAAQNLLRSAFSVVGPYLILAELWKASAPGAGDNARWQALPVPWYIKIWWALVLGDVFFIAAATLSMIKAEPQMILLAYGVNIIANSLTIFIIWNIYNRQHGADALRQNRQTQT